MDWRCDLYVFGDWMGADKMTDLPTLIAKLESAGEGSRELDAEIAVVVNPWLLECFPDHQRGDGHWIIPAGHSMNFGASGASPTYAIDYTTSLDAALTLVLPGYRIQITFDVPDGGGFVWIGDDWDSMKLRWTWNSDELEGDQDDPVILTCIAALKARKESAE